MLRNLASDEFELVSVWFESSIITHNFITKDFWAAEEEHIRKKYLPMAETYQR